MRKGTTYKGKKFVYQDKKPSILSKEDLERIEKARQYLKNKKLENIKW
jgi:hypothetical protein